MEEGLTGIPVGIIPDTGSLKEPVQRRLTSQKVPESTARKEVAARRLRGSHPEVVAEAKL